MNTPKLSVIVPIYKVEQYIERCARSLFEQTLDDIEYIFVDDCTPDKSVEILYAVLKDYPHRAPNVKVIAHEINKGLTRTRNTGLSIATGEYIAHCDSDDWVDCDMYRKLYNQAIISGSDVVYSDFYFAYHDKEVVCQTACSDPDKTVFLKNYISSIWTVIWNMIARRSIYEAYSLRSPEHICYCEDFWLTIRLLYHSSKTSKVNEPLYYYNQCNVSSIMHNLSCHAGDDMTCFMETIEMFTKEGNLSDFEEVLSWRVLSALHFDMYYPEKHKEIIATYPTAHKYILTCPFYTRKQKLMMWLLVHRCRLPVLLFIKIRNLLGREL